MNRVVSLAVLAGLAGCSAPDRSPARVCQAQADDDPEIRELIFKGVSNAWFQSQSQGELADVRARSVRDCLKRAGIVPDRGGVEMPHREPTLLQP